MSIACSCVHCTSACHNYPGWMTPDEAEAAIKDGLANKLMCDWLAPAPSRGFRNTVYVLCPASIGYEGMNAPEMPFFDFEWKGPGQCVFLTAGKCAIHESGFKPIQCREYVACQKIYGADKYAVATLWDTERGRMIVKEWQKILQQDAKD